MQKKFIIFIILIVSLTSLTACNKKEASIDNGKPLVYTSFYPLNFLVDRIAGDMVNNKMVIPMEVEPHEYEPSLSDLKKIAESDLFIYNGLGLESWSDRLVENLKDTEVVNGSEYINPILTNNKKDPHIWLDPKNMIKIGKVIEEKLIDIDKENKEKYSKNYTQLKKELEDLDKEFTSALKDKDQNNILVSHKAFSYMSEAYNFNQISIAGISPEEEPSSKTMSEIIKEAKKNNIKYICLEPLTNSKAVDIISKEANLEVLLLNPIESLTKDDLKGGEDYISIMYKNLEALKKALVK